MANSNLCSLDVCQFRPLSLFCCWFLLVCHFGLVFFVCLFVWLVGSFIFETGCHCNIGWPEIMYVDQAGIKLRNYPAFACHVLELKICTVMPSFHTGFSSGFSIRNKSICKEQ